MFQYIIYSWDTVLEAGEPEDVVYDRKEALAVKHSLSNSWIVAQVAYTARTMEKH